MACARARGLLTPGRMNATSTMRLTSVPVHNPKPEDRWLWCFLCERFFPLSTALEAGGGTLHRCPFSDCTGHGLDFELFSWDSCRVPEDSRWPASDAELYCGMRSPDYASFAQAQFDKRLAPVLRSFEASPEYRAAFERPPRYSATFLTMMAGVYHSDLTDLDVDADDLRLRFSLRIGIAILGKRRSQGGCGASAHDSAPAHGARRELSLDGQDVCALAQ